MVKNGNRNSNKRKNIEKVSLPFAGHTDKIISNTATHWRDMSVWHEELQSRNDVVMSPRHSERGKKTTQTKEEVERQHQGIDRPGVRRGQWGTGKDGGNWL